MADTEITDRLDRIVELLELFKAWNEPVRFIVSKEGHMTANDWVEEK